MTPPPPNSCCHMTSAFLPPPGSPLHPAAASHLFPFVSTFHLLWTFQLIRAQDSSQAVLIFLSTLMVCLSVPEKVRILRLIIFIVILSLKTQLTVAPHINELKPSSSSVFFCRMWTVFPNRWRQRPLQLMLQLCRCVHWLPCRFSSSLSRIWLGPD